MADTFNNEINVGPPPVTLRKRRSFGAIGIIALLLILGGGAGLAWLNYDTLMDMTHSVAGGADASALASASDASVSATDFAAFQQQTGSSIQAATDLLAAQQAEMKRLSDQISALTTQVAGLTSKIDQMPGRGPLQAPVAQAPAMAPSAPAMASTAAVSTAAPRPPAAARKRPADKPAGAISVGGAPLPAQPAR